MVPSTAAAMQHGPEQGIEQAVMGSTAAKPAAKLPTKGWIRRQLAWRHNGFHGSVRMSRMQMLAIMQAHTPTDASKQLAAQIEGLLEKLGESLKTRRPWPRSLQDGDSNE